MAVRSRYRAAACLAAILALPLVGCSEDNTYVPPPPPKVSVAEPLLQDVTDYLEFTGTTESTAQVVVRARVPGVLQSMNFQPGEWVEEDQVLFTIDPQEYQAEVAVAEAALAQAKARKIEADKTLERAEKLITRGNISQAKVDEAEANARAAVADVKASEARLLQAQINLGYTEVVAPISGRAGRNLVDVGNLVGEGEATKLTDITVFDPMFVYFTLNERDLLRVMARFRERATGTGSSGSRGHAERQLPLELGLANEEGYPHEGITDFAESSVDPGTGTLRLRGVIPNSGDPPKLLPGLFARVRMPYATRADVPLVSERAIGTDQTGRFVLVVNAENVVEKRNVELGQSIDGLRVIESGLAPSELVVVNGIQRARPGGTVDPETVDMRSLATSAILAQKAESRESAPQDAAKADDSADDDAAEQRP